MLGHQNARRSVLALIISQLALLVALVVFGVLKWPVLIALLSGTFLWKLVAVYRKETPEAPPEDYPPNVWPLWYSAHAFVSAKAL